MDKFASMTLVHLKTVAYATALEEAKNGLPVILSDPTTYGYYKNLAGIPTQSNASPIMVISKDTNQEVDLLTVNENTHPITRQSFLKQETIFDDVLVNYPNNILLVYGTLLDFGTVQDIIDLDDGTLLYYDPTVLSPREVDAIYLLEKDIQKQLNEFDNPLFTETDDLYASGLLIAVKTLIETRLQIIRESKVESRQVPDYLIEKRLSSYYDLGKVMKLSDNVKVWLYHNLPYLSINVGKTETFDALVEHVVEELGFNITTVFLKTVHPTEVLVNNSTVPQYNNCIFRTTPSKGVTVSENYSAILFKKLNEAVVLKESIIQNEQFNYFDRHIKLNESTRYYRVGVEKIPVKPLVSRFVLAFESITTELLNTERIHLVKTIDDNILSLSSKNLYLLLIGLYLKSIGSDLNVELKQYPTSTIFYNHALPELYEETRFGDLLNILTPTWTPTWTASDTYNDNLNKWFSVAEQVGLHQSSYNMFVIRIVDTLTTGASIGFTSPNIGQELHNKGITLPDDPIANIVFIMNDVFGIVVNQQEIINNNLAIVEDILTKLTSYTVEVIPNDSNPKHVSLYTQPIHMTEDLEILKINTVEYNCNGYIVESVMSGADDVQLKLGATFSTNISVNDATTPKINVTPSVRNVRQYNKAMIQIT